MANCRQCEKELPKIWATDICLECSKTNIQKIVKESIEEMRKPKNMEKMVDDTVKFMQALRGARE